ncbi:unnamed protein product [Rotaria magnacalcarata]|uniref:Uncharacterized protein n=2 Tax=Rotaria magnacalcarata TaxID=392030 RepID=A0A819SRJ7_9BILA|nr:unnamed protein product [Rotaria magnacalcarata]CAF2136403.1 unnamed protein product [Rotaria magnacalcarata]CAF4067012.1 unnamed protein product [Rotaria magnacalcarata]CAF4261863.1 unnamed protein product [Rotaria magnacalcarata]
MITDSLLTLSSKPSCRHLHSTGTSLTDVSSFSTRPMMLKETCSCSTCTCSNKSFVYQNKLKSAPSFSFENNDNCLTYAFITLYESSLWCMQIIYELFFKSLWQIFMYLKQEIQYDRSRHQTCNHRVDMVSINKSTMNNYSLTSKKRNYSDLSRYHLRLNEARNRERHRRLPRNNRLLGRENTLLRKDLHPVSSNQNMNQTSCKQQDSRSIDTNVVFVPIRSSYCQTDTLNNDLPTINVDLNQSEKTINLSEQLTDKVHHCLHEPLMLMTREMSCRQNRTSFYSTIPSGDNLFQQSSNEKKEILCNECTKPMNVQTDKALLSNSNQIFNFHLHQGKQCPKKIKQNRRIIDDCSIPLTLTTSLHSNLSLYNEDYFLKKIYS